MRGGLEALSEREKETLRLLLRGHDAKSIARAQGLSVHTVNERLRDARGKLGVSSSREAARLLAAAEGGDPNSLTDKQFGVAETALGMREGGTPHRRWGAGHRLAWLGGGMLVMSLVIAALVLSLAAQGGGAPGAQGGQGGALATPAPDESRSAGIGAARAWVALVDRGQWEESWRAAADLFKSQLTPAQWTASVQPVREPLGAVVSRAFLGVTKTASLPGAPPGDYEVLQFTTDFAGKGGAVETVVLAREGSAWKVAGYFIR